jgi:hypothetical protein
VKTKFENEVQLSLELTVGIKSGTIPLHDISAYTFEVGIQVIVGLVVSIKDKVNEQFAELPDQSVEVMVISVFEFIVVFGAGDCCKIRPKQLSAEVAKEV